MKLAECQRQEKALAQMQPTAARRQSPGPPKLATPGRELARRDKPERDGR